MLLIGVRTGKGLKMLKANVTPRILEACKNVYRLENSFQTENDPMIINEWIEAMKHFHSVWKMENPEENQDFPMGQYFLEDYISH